LFKLHEDIKEIIDGNKTNDAKITEIKNLCNQLVSSDYAKVNFWKWVKENSTEDDQGRSSFNDGVLKDKETSKAIMGAIEKILSNILLAETEFFLGEDFTTLLEQYQKEKTSTNGNSKNLGPNSSPSPTTEVPASSEIISRPLLNI